MTDFNSLEALQQGLVTGRSGLRATQRVLARTYGNAAEGLGFSGALFAREIINQSVEKVSERVSAELEIFAQAMSNKAARNRDFRVNRIHEIAGALAVQATVRSYERTRAKRRKAARLIINPEVASTSDGPAQRVGRQTRFQPQLLTARERTDRFANGKLSRALASPNMYDARWDGVSFINARWLDQQAKQWYRLSFGAGQRGAQTPPHRSYNVKFFDESVFSMSLATFGPSRGFSMPAGIWFGFEPNQAFAGGALEGLGAPGAPDRNRRGLDQFVPASQLPPNARGRAFAGRRTAGIRGTAYLDAGVNALTKALGEGWSVLMTEWFQEAADSETGPIAAIGVSPKTAAKSARKLTQELRDMEVDVARWKSQLAL